MTDSSQTLPLIRWSRLLKTFNDSEAQAELFLPLFTFLLCVPEKLLAPG